MSGKIISTPLSSNAILAQQMVRIDGRKNNELRPVRITMGYQSFAEGSALIEVGNTKVVCSVTAEDRVPKFIRGSGEGWITAEYDMLPRSTLTRTSRDRTGGRKKEIQRLIGRSLRAAANLSSLGERTFIVDCDVLQADGGTRTAAITGGYVALYQAFHNMVKHRVLHSMPLERMIAATSTGIVGRKLLLDLCYEEDYRAEVDFNVVMTDNNEFVEIQATAEGHPFSTDATNSLLALAQQGITHLFQVQKEALSTLS
jgi:ribonuclease PH